MSQVNQHITVERGATYMLDVDLLDDDNAPLNLFGTQLFYRLSPDAGDDPVIEIDSADIATSEGSGFAIATITLTVVHTKSVSPGTYYHELYMRDSTGNIAVLFTGSVAVIDAAAADYA